MTVRQWLYAGLIALGSQTSAWATVYDLPADGSAVVGTDQHIKSTYKDTLLDIAHRYSLGYEEIIRANPGVDMWLPGEGTDILLPGRRILPSAPHEGIVVNLPEHRLYYYPKPKKHHKMRLAVGDGTYEIHGTNNPLAVGMAITHGCIRMYPEDVAALFAAVPMGTKVWLINDPVKVAYVEGDLLVEAHPPVDSEGQTLDPDLELLSKQLDKALGNSTAAIHWDFAREALQAATGMPTVVGLEAEFDPTKEGTAATAPAPQAPVRR